MMKKTIVENIIKTIAFIMLFIILFNFSNNFLADKQNRVKFDEFYNEKEDFDVLFFGSSRILVAVSPVQIYEKSGITSYNMAQAGEMLRTTYWQIQNALKYTKPHVIVVDCSMYDSSKMNEDSGTFSYLHKSLDHMALSPLKISAVYDILEKDVNHLEYIMPISIYHNRWNQLAKEDFYDSDENLMGLSCRINTEVFENALYATDETDEDISESAGYFYKILDLCEEKDIQLVLTVMPSYYSNVYEPGCRIYNTMEKAAKERNIPFINFGKMDGMFDFKKDFSDNGHVNFGGTRIISDYLCSYLSENYTYETKNDKTYARWDNISKEYNAWLNNWIEYAKAANDETLYTMFTGEKIVTSEQP